MKIQHLAVIFIIIILPISMVISTYVNNLISVSNKQAEYDSILLNSTYDAVRAYQINTLNNDFASVSASRNRDLNASINSFFNSLATGVSSSAYTKTELNSYIPAILFTLYDGFYLYGPHENYADITTTEIDGEIKKVPAYKTDRSDAKTEYGLKPYTYYSCEYKGSDYHLIINYTLDNYIGVCGMVGDDYITSSGYYIDPTNVIETNGKDHELMVGKENPVTIGPEILGEYQQVYDSEIVNKQTINKQSYHRYYNYINYNETKYYYDDFAAKAIEEWKSGFSTNVDNLAQQNRTFGFKYKEQGTNIVKQDYIPIFAINNNKKEYISIDLLEQLAKWRGCDPILLRNKEMFNDINNYNYYKEAKEFSERIQPILAKIQLNKDEEGKYIEVLTDSFNNVYEIETNDGVKAEEGTDALKAHEKHNYDGKNVLDSTQPGNDPELETSDFNQHRMDVIISTVEDSLSDAIADFNVFQSNNTYSYRMPAITEDDWYKIANNVNIVSFMQGQVVGNYKFYNNYAIVTDTKNKEFISKDAIYVQDVIPESKEVSKLRERKIKEGITSTGQAFDYIQGELEDNYINDNNSRKHHYPGCVEFHNNASTIRGDTVGYRLIDYDVDSFLHDYKTIEESGGVRYVKKDTPEGGDTPVDVVDTEVINSYMQPGTGGYECIVSRNNAVDWSYDELMTGKTDLIERTDEQKIAMSMDGSINIAMNQEVRRAYISALAREKGASFKNYSMLTTETARYRVYEDNSIT